MKNKKYKWLLIFIPIIILIIIILSNPVEIPKITIIEPLNNVSIQANSVVIKGNAEPEKATILVNGKEINRDGKNFEYEFKLNDKNEVNNIEIKAVNENQSDIKTITINRIFTEDEKKVIEEAKINEQKEKEEAIVFNIPSLIGKDINQIINILGTPSDNTEPTKLQLEMGTDTWDKTWKKESYSLLVTYNTKTKKIIDFFLNQEKNDQNIQEIMLAGNLSKNNTNYEITLVESRNKSLPGYTGIIIKAK